MLELLVVISIIAVLGSTMSAFFLWAEGHVLHTTKVKHLLRHVRSNAQPASADSSALFRALREDGFQVTLEWGVLNHANHRFALWQHDSGDPAPDLGVRLEESPTWMLVAVDDFEQACWWTSDALGEEPVPWVISSARLRSLPPAPPAPPAIVPWLTQRGVLLALTEVAWRVPTFLSLLALLYGELLQALQRRVRSSLGKRVLGLAGRQRELWGLRTLQLLPPIARGLSLGFLGMFALAC